MSSKAEVQVIKSPISPVRIPDDFIIYANRAVYYVKLSNGLIASSPEDFVNNEHEAIEVKIKPEQTEEEA
jgi:hypothetical protein